MKEMKKITVDVSSRIELSSLPISIQYLLSFLAALSHSICKQKIASADFPANVTL